MTVSLWNERLDRLEVASSQGESPVPIGLLVARDELSDSARKAIAERITTTIDYDALEPGRRGVADTVTSHLALDVPLFVGDRFVGLLATDDPGESGEFSDREIRLIEGVAAQAAVAIENARLFEAESAALAGVTLLKEIAAAAAGALELKELAETALAAVHRLLDATTGNLFVIDEQAGVLRSLAHFGVPQEALHLYREVPLDGETASARVALSGKLVTHDTKGLPKVTRRVQHVTGAAQSDWVILPVRARDKTVGTLGISFESARPFTQAELALYQSVADQLGVGLEKARLLEAERKAQQQAARELERTRLLQEVTTAATSSLSLHEIGRDVLALTTQALGASGAAIYAVDEMQGEVHALALSGYFEEVANEIAVVPVDEQTSIGRLVVHDLPLITFESDNIGPASEERARSLSGQDARWLMLPTKRAGRTLGVLGFMFSGKRSFQEDELSLYRSIAELLGAALENARLFEEQQRIATSLQENLIHPLPSVEGLELGVRLADGHRAGARGRRLQRRLPPRERSGSDRHRRRGRQRRARRRPHRDRAQHGARLRGHRHLASLHPAQDQRAAPALRPGGAARHRLLLRARPAHGARQLSPAPGIPPLSIWVPAPAASSTCHMARVLGAFPSDYTTDHIMLTLEDYLVLYTDGVTEARRDGELFGERRLVETDLRPAWTLGPGARRGRSRRGAGFRRQAARRPAGGRHAVALGAWASCPTSASGCAGVALRGLV